MQEFGFLTMAFGAPRYIAQAEALAHSLRLHMPDLPICLVTDKPREVGLFDDIVVMDPIGVRGTVLKTRMYDYSPYEETLFIDSDCLVMRPIHDHIDKMRAWDFTPVCNSYLKAGDTDLWLEDIGAALEKVGGEAFAKFNGGIYFFRKSEHAREVFFRSLEILERASDLGVLDFDSAGPGEETLIGLALAQMQAGPLYDDDFGLMRTPLNSSGAIFVDPVAGRSRIAKNGREMSPAILHFCGAYSRHPAYAAAKEAVRRGQRLSSVSPYISHFKWKLAKLRERAAA